MGMEKKGEHEMGKASYKFQQGWIRGVHPRWQVLLAMPIGISRRK